VQTGKVKLQIAQLVDNGNTVPLTVSVDHPMTDADHVSTVAVFNQRNPQREVAIFTLGARAGKAQVSTRIRLATSQRLVAVAKLSDGSYWSQSADVIVTLAACIEGET
jgi:sulfur-oxidizing protein SoxY